MQDLIIKIDEQEFNAKFTDGNPNIAINGHPYQVELMRQLGRNIYSFSVNNKMCQVEFDINEKEQSHIMMNGMSFDIDITNETKRMIEQYIKQSGIGNESGNLKVKAPMPGLVVKILIEEGQTIHKGDKVIIVEAMKMENALQSSIDAVVKSIRVREGQPVEKDALLIELEATV